MLMVDWWLSHLDWLDLNAGLSGGLRSSGTSRRPKTSASALRRPVTLKKEFTETGFILGINMSRKAEEGLRGEGSGRRWRRGGGRRRPRGWPSAATAVDGWWSDGIPLREWPRRPSSLDFFLLPYVISGDGYKRPLMEVTTPLLNCSPWAASCTNIRVYLLHGERHRSDLFWIGASLEALVLLSTCYPHFLQFFPGNLSSATMASKGCSPWYIDVTDPERKKTGTVQCTLCKTIFAKRLERMLSHLEYDKVIGVRSSGVSCCTSLTHII